MAFQQSIRQIIQQLPLGRKLLGLGSIGLIISLMLPWYQEKGSLNSIVYLGLTGPLYLIGFTFLVFAFLNIFFLIYETLGKKIDFFSIKVSYFPFFTGIFSFYLLLMESSIYSHRQFGVNVLTRQSEFGMFFAFLATALITIGGYLIRREHSGVLQKEIQKVTVSQQMPLHDPRKPKENLGLRQNISSKEFEAVISAQPVEAVKQTSMKSGSKITEKVHTKSSQAPQPFRMDL